MNKNIFVESNRLRNPFIIDPSIKFPDDDDWIEPSKPIKKIKSVSRSKSNPKIDIEIRLKVLGELNQGNLEDLAIRYNLKKNTIRAWKAHQTMGTY